MEGKLKLTALDQRRIEDLVDKARQLFRSGEHHRGQLSLVARGRGGGQKARGSHDRIELVSEQMAEVSQQLGIQRVVDGRRAVGWAVSHIPSTRSSLRAAVVSGRTSSPGARCPRSGSAAGTPNARLSPC